MAIPTHIRKKIADFDPVRDGKTITKFCKEIGVSRQTYNNIKHRIAERGRAGIIPDSTAPKNPARKFDVELRQLVVQARQVLKETGRDYGPWSIYYYLLDDLRMENPPQRSTIALWLHEAGVVDGNARKRPRSSYKRFARAKVNELWQIDGFVYRLFDTAHTQITIYQLIDDASRFDLGSQAFSRPENGVDARATLAAAMDSYGCPQEVLSDNGEAFATYHRGRLSDTERWLAGLGVWSIAGFAPQTQGKDERSHQTIFRYLDARTPTTIEQVHKLLVEYRNYYNTKRRHQGLNHGKMHITPAQAREILDHATPPAQPVDPDVLWAKIATYYHSMHGGFPAGRENALDKVAASPKAHNHDSEPIHQDSRAIDDSSVAAITPASSNSWGIPDELWINRSGVVTILKHRLYVGTRWKNRMLYSQVSNNHAEFFTAHDGELLFSFPLPITLLHRPAGGQINIGHVEGMWHRRPPEIKPILSRPRPSRRKKP
ncbi:DDE-type integrase/transposase/recombinase [Corynebacterium sp. SCR221107]|uniref:DDE-type integrase/transposase/recombinase n=1 Tax=Corynebacterium sp. SCR221107 TaxID=3017361 RepID=UPI0022EC18D2|nr:DDE-type integrase/transposase/recombinase [Corynebacterium sp. SCR221107]WBT09015.1 DDE-type integrase/transposase/recombinase [Corynebacterium sp. SCR221107]